MEHIGKTLGNLDRESPTQKVEPELEPTLEEQREDLRKSLGVASLDNTFENFKALPGTEQALSSFNALASGETDWKMLLCYGGVGNGKTHLCEATAITLYKRGLFGRVLTMAKLMGALKNTMRSDSGLSMDALMGLFSNSKVLIIDDVGMGGSGSEWEYGQLEEIIVHRYRERLFTILTTNRDITELPERITSRFRDPEKGRVVLNKGEDYRVIR